MPLPPSIGIGLHVCCAPCLARTRETARVENSLPEITKIFFFNPNIHPLLEFRRRLKALRIYLERDCLSAEIEDSYGLGEFLEFMLENGKPPSTRRERCRKCYFYRLQHSAERCKVLGLHSLTTTLLASHEQDHDLIADAGREACALHSVEFLSRDFSCCEPGEKIMRGIYKQQYCGCIFSEAERYQNTTKHLYRSPEAE